MLAQHQRERQRLATDQQQPVSHARFAAPQARHRYAHGDPAYRLVAAALAREWDDRLRALRQAAAAAERFAHEPHEPPLTPEFRHQLLHLRQCLPELWGSPQRNYPQRQALLRRLISRGIVKRTAADRVEGQSIWASGHCSEGVVLPPVGSQRQVTGDDTMVERTRQWWAAGYSDLHMADVLRQEGLRSAQRETVLAKTVMKMRHRPHWVSPYHQQRFADKREEPWTIRGLARELGVESGWVYNRMRNGFLREADVSRQPPHGHGLIRDDATLRARLRAEVKRSRRLRSTAAPASILPGLGEFPRQSGEGESSVSHGAITSRTHCTLHGSNSDA